MNAITPQTPSRKDASALSFSPSPSQYLNYAYESCPSPTPLPTHNSRVPTTISPYEYQLAHLGLKPAAPDASSALKADYRSFGTLTAAETLLSVQSGSGATQTLPTPPSSHKSSLRRPRHDAGLESPSRLIWSSNLSSSFSSPFRPRAEDNASLATALSAMSTSGSPSKRSLSFSSSFEQGSSSSQLTSVGWQEPHTPSTSGRRIEHSKPTIGAFVRSEMR